MSHNAFRRVAVLLGTVALTGSLAVAPALAATEPHPDLRVDLSFDDHVYLPDEAVDVKVTITNMAAYPNYANDVQLSFQNVAGSTMWLRGTSPCCSSTFLAPGETIVVTATLALANWTGEQPTVAVGATTPGEVTPGDNAHKIDIRFVPPDRTGGVSGLVYADRNNNHQVDDGEALTSGTAALNSLRGPRTTPVDATGHYHFDAVPVGTYTLNFNDLPDGWIAPDSTKLRVDGTDATNGLQARATRPISDVLEASAKLTKDSYTQGEPVTVNVTLDSKAELTGVKAFCDWSDFRLTNVSLGALAPSGDGATLHASSGNEFQITANVRQSAQVPPTSIYLSCSYGIDQDYRLGFPTTYVSAPVTNS